MSIPVLILIALLVGSLLLAGLYHIYYERSSTQIPSPAPAPFRPTNIIDLEYSALCSPSMASHGAEAMWLVLDTETAEVIPTEQEEALNFISPAVSLSWMVLDAQLQLIREEHHVLRRGQPITPQAAALHGIDNEAMLRGEDATLIYSRLLRDMRLCRHWAGHNLAFHLGIISADLSKLNLDKLPEEDVVEALCSMQYGRMLGFKRRSDGTSLYPRLEELFGYLHFGNRHISVRYRTKGLRDIRLVMACLRIIAQPHRNKHCQEL